MREAICIECRMPAEQYTTGAAGPVCDECLLRHAIVRAATPLPPGIDSACVHNRTRYEPCDLCYPPG